MADGERYGEWLDLAADLLSRPTPVFPGRELLQRLSETFQTTVAWQWRDPDGSTGFEAFPAMPSFPEPAAMDYWARHMLSVHPLAHWFAATDDPRPMTVGRVIGRQTKLLGRARPVTAASAVVLTGRELAVLTLLRQGRTAQAIGRGLSMSPRTVHSHLANIYRKLGVNDRMRAVLVAQELGLFHQPGQPIALSSTVLTHASWPVPKQVGWLLEAPVAQQRPERNG